MRWRNYAHSRDPGAKKNRLPSCPVKKIDGKVNDNITMRSVFSPVFRSCFMCVYVRRGAHRRVFTSTF